MTNQEHKTSNTIGVGIDVEATAANRLRCYIAESVGYSHCDIYLTNMATGGG